ncbi:MAG: DUF4037 domain-containing protein [Ruminococcus sp.]
MFEKLWRELAQLPEVTAIALGGSRSGENYDEKSDYDLYLYVTAIPDESVRRQILSKYCSYMEISNSFWELEDDCTLKSGIDIDILYRDLDSFEKGVASVVEGFNAGTGYTTCMWHNLKTCKILYDEKGLLKKAQERFNVPYPEKLKGNIISKNLKLLHGMLPSYDGQIKKASGRNDLVAVNHRVAAFMESYFEIIFAMNKMTHPGEKRQVKYAKKYATKLPYRFEENITDLFKVLFADFDKVNDIIKQMYEELDKVLD